MVTRKSLVLAFTIFLAFSGLKAQTQNPNGSADNPFPIKDSLALAQLRNCLNNNGTTFYFCTTDSSFVTNSGSDRVQITKTNPATCYKLLSDIDMNPGKNVAACDGDATGLMPWVPIKHFHGQLDGDHHIISGLLINSPTVDTIGFINQIHSVGNVNTSIKNLGIANAYISGKEKVGGLVGYMQAGSVTHCFVDAVLVGSVQEVGGLFGYASGVTVTDCYATGSITCLDEGQLGGICGHGVNAIRLNNCYSSVVINHDSRLTSSVGGIIGGSYSTENINKCYYDKQMCVPSANDSIGTGLQTSEMFLQSVCDLGSQFVYHADRYPSLSGFPETNAYVRLSTTPILLPSEANMKNLDSDFSVGGAGISWIGTNNQYAKVLNSGTVEVYKEGWLQLIASLEGKTHTVAFYTHKAPFIGTPENPFTIDNYSDLTKFRDGVNSDKEFIYKHFTVNALAAGTWFQQTDDISLEEVSNWRDQHRIGITSAIAFKGGYDGAGHKITDLRIDGGTYSGFFGYIKGGSVKNLNIYVKEFKPGEYSGPLCGQVSKDFTIDNCHSYTMDELGVLYLRYRTGGLIGESDSSRGVISNCSNHCNIVALNTASHVGGIIGQNRHVDSLTIRDCQNFGTLTGEIQNVAGITSSIGGSANGKVVIERCKNTADMYCTHTWTSLGGIISFRITDDNGGNIPITISYCENYGNLTTSYRVAGIACASNVTSIHHCVNAGDLWVKDIGQREASNAYGITVSADVYSCLNAGKVTADRGGNAYAFSSWGSFDCFNAGELTAHSEGYRTLPFNGWNGQHASTQRNINIGRVNGVVTYWGSTNSNKKNYNFCDKQMVFDAHNSQSANTSYNTIQMLGTNLQTDLGTDNWVFTPGMYPRIKGLDTLPISIVVATPVIFSGDQTINSVETNPHVGCTTSGVEWKYNGVAVSSGCSGNQQEVTLRSSVIGLDTLVVTYNGVSKKVRFCRKVNAPSTTLQVATIEDLRTLRDGINSAAPFEYNNGGTTVTVPAGGRGTKFKQTADISMLVPTDDNWEPIGKVDAQFYGDYDGDSNIVSHLKQHNMLNGGLFGYAYKSKIQNVLMANVKISEIRAAAGALIAVSDYTEIKNCSASGEVSGTNLHEIANNVTAYNNVDNSIGGLIGNGYFDKVISCVNNCTVTGHSKSSVGGIMGRGYYNVNSYMDSCANYGTINGKHIVGGLVGQQQTIRNSYNAGEVKGTLEAVMVGGLAGHAALVTNSFNTGMVSAVPSSTESHVGGLVGQVRNASFALIENCYNAGIVDGNNRTYVGGIFGSSLKQDEWGSANGNNNNVKLHNTYVSNAVNGTGEHVGAIVGLNIVDPNNTHIRNNYYDTTFSYVKGINGVDVPGKAVGLYTDRMVGTALQDSLGAANFTYGDANYYPRLTGGSTPDWPASLASAAKLQLEKDENGQYELAKSVTLDHFTVGGCSDSVKWSQRNGNQIDFNDSLCEVTIQGFGVLYIQSSHSGKSYKIVKLNVGNSAKNPLEIIDSLELVHFRNFINAGDTFYYDLQSKRFHATRAEIPDTNNIFTIPNQGEGLFFKLTCDGVDFKGASDWTPIGTKENPFKGFFNGGGHTITRLNLTTDKDTVGFFGYLGRGLTDRGSIDSLYFTDIQLGGTGSIKGVVCAYNDGGVITACKSDNATITTSGNGSAWGGICGYSNTGELFGCSSTGCTISGANGSSVKNVGGVLGYGYKGTVADCELTGLTIGNTKGDNYGGVCGYVKENSIARCQIDGGTFNFSHQNCGGICGFDSLSSITDCSFLNASITCSSQNANNIGGIVGRGYFNRDIPNLIISGCYTGGDGSVTASMSSCVGGLIGRLHGNYVSINKCSNHIPVTGKDSVGGIGGLLTCQADSCHNTADIIGYTCVGGLIGQGEGSSLSRSYNIGDIKAGKESSSDEEDPVNGDYSGGLIGKNASYHINECFNSGRVQGTDYVGGLAGLSGKAETNSYNAGQVYGSFYVGGLAGLKGANAETSSHNYNIGYIEGNNITGALYGSVSNVSSVTNCFYDKQFSYAIGIEGVDLAGQAEGKLTTEMTGTGLSMGDTWKYMENMYPQVEAFYDAPFAMKASVATASPFFLHDNDEVAWAIEVGPLRGEGSSGTRWRTEGGSMVLTTDDNLTFELHKVGILNMEAFDPVTDSVYKRVHLMVSISEEHPIEIKDYTQLANFRDLINAGNVFYYDPENKLFFNSDPNNSYIEIPPGGESMYFKLMVDVDLSTYANANPWKPIGGSKNKAFKGHFNGNGKTISNMVVNNKGNSGTYHGFFGYSSGTIKDLTVENANVIGSTYQAAVCGYNNGGSIIHCVALGGTVKGSSFYTGGVCGRSQNGTISNCYSSCNVNGTSYVGGIAGRIENGVTTECFNMGRVTAEGHYPQSGSGIYQYSQYAGGIAGRNSSYLSYCYNTGIVSGEDWVGGIVGLNEKERFSSLYNAGSVIITETPSGFGSNVGGLANIIDVDNNDDHYPMNGATDIEMAPDVLAVNQKDRFMYKKLTVEMVAGSLQSTLGTDKWVYTDSLYPRLKVFAEGIEQDALASIVSATPVFLQGAQTVTDVSLSFITYNKNGVTWELARPSNAVDTTHANLPHSGIVDITSCDLVSFKVFESSTSREVDLHVRNEKTYTVKDTTCGEGYVWDFNGMYYPVSGDYQQSIDNGSICDEKMSLQLVIPEPLAITLTPSMGCTGSNQSSVTATVSGGIKAGESNTYTYVWTKDGDETLIGNGTTSETDLSLANLEPGTYTLTVQDANNTKNCSVTQTVEIVETESLTISEVTTDGHCQNNNDGTLSFRISGGTAPYTINWTTPASSPTPFEGTAHQAMDGTYSMSGLSNDSLVFTIFDQGGCSAKDTLVIKDNDDREYEIIAHSETKKHDGVSVNPHQFTLRIGETMYEATGNTLTRNDTTYTVEFSTSSTGLLDAGITPNNITSVTVRKGEVDITCKLNLTTTDGLIVIEKRNVTLTSGTVVENTATIAASDNVVITGDGFPSSVGIEYTDWTEQVGVGSKRNTFNYVLTGTNPDNYNITKVYGVLTVLEEHQAIVHADTTSKVYDGTPLYATYNVAVPDDIKVDIIVRGDENFEDVTNNISITGLVMGSNTPVSDISIVDAGSKVLYVKIVSIYDNTHDITETYTNLNTTPGQLNITPRPITLVSNSHSKVYDGDTLKDETVTIVGDIAVGESHLFADNVTDLKAVTKIVNVSTASNEIQYTLPTAIAGNFAVSTMEGTLEITKRAASYTGQSGTVPYNGSEQCLEEITASGLVSGHVLTGVTYSVCGTNPDTYEGVFQGTEKVTAGTTDVTGNYDLTSSTGSLIIQASASPLVIRSVSANSDYYDGQVHKYQQYEVSYNGVAATLAGTASDGISKQYRLPVTGDTVTITPTGAGADGITHVPDAPVVNDFSYTLQNSDNYLSESITLAKGTLTLAPRIVVISSLPFTKVYDGERISRNEISITGMSFVDGEGLSDTVWTFMDATNYITAGKYLNRFDIALKSNTSLSDYSITLRYDTLTITKAILTVTARDTSHVYGSEPPGDDELTYTLSGFVNDESETGLRNADPIQLSGEPALSQTTTNASPVGSDYVITAEPGDLWALNYDFLYENGTMVVMRRPIHISALPIGVDNNGDYNITYDGATHTFSSPPALGADYTIADGDLRVGDVVSSVTMAGSARMAGHHSNAVTVTGCTITNGSEDVTGSYQLISVDTFIHIKAKPLTIRISTGGTHTYDGQPHCEDALSPSFGGMTYEVEGLVDNGTVRDEIAHIAFAGGGTTYSESPYPVYVDLSTLFITNSNLDANINVMSCYDITCDMGDISISQVECHLKISSDTAVFNYTGSAQQYPHYKVHYNNTVITDYTISGGDRIFTLPTGDKLTVTPTNEASITMPSQNPVQNTFTYVLQNAGSYAGQRDTAYGLLTINRVAQRLEIISGSASFDYDNNIHDYPRYTVMFDNQVVASEITEPDLNILIPTGHHINITPTFPGIRYDTENEESNNIFTYTVTNSSDGTGPDFSGMYSDRVVTFGTVQINPGTMTVTVVSDSKTYDGTPLYASGSCSVSDATLWYSTDGLTWSAEVPSITTGSLTYRVKATKPGYTDAISGSATLTINPNATPIKVIPGSGSKPYDGTPLTKNEPDDFEVTGIPDGFTWTAMADGSVTNVNPGPEDKVVNEVTEFRIFKNNAEVTSQFSNIEHSTGLLTVTARPITITAGSSSKMYDGTPLVEPGYSVTSGSIAPTDELISVTIESSRTYKGSSDNVPSAAVICTSGTTTNVTSNYDIGFANGLLTVTANDKPVTITSATNGWTYDGLTHKDSTYTVTYDGSGDGVTMDATGKVFTLPTGDMVTITPTAAGVKNVADNLSQNNTFAYVLSGDTNYTGSALSHEFGTLTINPCAITIAAEEKEKVYDNNPATDPALTATVGNRPADGDAVVYTLSRGGGQNAGDYPITVHAEAANNPNYTVVTSGNTFHITKATLTVTAVDLETEYGVLNHNFTYTPSGFKTGDNASVISGTVGYDGPATLTTTASEPGNYTIEPDVTELSATNYVFVPVNGTLTIHNSSKVIKITSPNHNWTYDGAPHSDHLYTVTYGGIGLAGSADGDSYKYTIAATGDTITVTPDASAVVTDHASTATPNAFTYSVTNSDRYLSKEVSTGQLTVSQRHITVTVENDTVEFNDDIQYGKTDYTFNNLVSGHTATIDYTPASGKEISPVAYDNGSYDHSSLVVKDIHNNVVTGNYTLSTITGKLKINPPPLTVKADTLSKVYDGIALSAQFSYEPANASVSVRYKVKSGDTWPDTYTTGIPSITDAGTATYLVEATANNYTVTDTATLTITKRDVTVTVGDTTGIEYTGGEHHSEKEPVFHNVVTGQTPSISYHPAHGILVGTYTGEFVADSFKVRAGATDVTGNYNLTSWTPGKLTIVNRTEKYNITVIANSDSNIVYDGLMHSAIGYDTTVHANGHHFTVVNLTTSNPISKNVCNTANTLTGEPVVMDIHGNDVTEQFNVTLQDGLLRIKERPITLKSMPGTKAYNGTPLTRNSEHDVVVESEYGFAAGEGATYNITGSQTYVGTSPNTFTYTLHEGTLATNYIINTIFGTLTVTPDTFPISIVSLSGEWYYDGEIHRRDEYRVFYHDDACDTVPGTNGMVFVIDPQNRKDTLTITSTFGGITEVSQNSPNNNSFTYTLQHDDQYAGKRDTTYGTVSINPVEVRVTIKGNVLAETYNGSPHTVTGYEVEFISHPLYLESYFEYIGDNDDTIATREDAGDEYMNLSISSFQNTNDNFSVLFTVKNGYIHVGAAGQVIVIIEGNHNECNYDGTGHTVTGYSIRSISNDIYTENHFHFTGDSTVSRTLVGTDSMGLTPEMFVNDAPVNFPDVIFVIYYDGYQTIDPIAARVKVTGHTNTVEYDGDEHTVTGYALEFTPALYTADDFRYDGDSTATRTFEGTTMMNLDPSEFHNLNDNFHEVIFTISDGYQEIKPNTTALTLTCPDGDATQKVYDGTPLTEVATATSTIAGDEFVIQYKTKLDGQTSWSDWTYDAPSITDYGVLLVEVSCTNPNYRTKTCSYSLSIHKRTLEMISADSTRIYNGDFLTYDSVKVSGDGFASGEGASYTVTGKQLLPGHSPNEFTYELSQGTLAENYHITRTFGTLQVTERPEELRYPITVVSNTVPASNDDLIFYDGLKHTDSDFVSLQFTTVDNHNYTVTGITAKVSAFDAGTYPNVIHGDPVVLDEYGNDVTDQFKIQPVEGHLTILKHPTIITVPSEHATMMYNGDSLKVGFQEIALSYLADRDTLVSGYIVTEGYEVGAYHCNDGNFMATSGVASQHDFNIVHGASEEYDAGNSLANYRPTFSVTLTITKRPLEITASSAEKVYDGEPLTLEEADYTLTSGTSIAPTDTLVITRTGVQACVGETANHISSVRVLHKIDWVDVTSCYDITTIDGLLKVNPATTGLTCPATIDIILTEDTYDTIVPQSLLGMATHSLVDAGTAIVTNNLDDLNPLTVGNHTITWTLYDTCLTPMATCDQLVEVEYTPCEAVHYNGHEYSAKRIGYQCWLTENLRNTLNSSNEAIANYHAFKDNEENTPKFGYLYSWYSAMNVTENDDTALPVESIGDNGRPYVQGICPNGWAVGSQHDFSVLFASVGDITLLNDAGSEYWIPESVGTLPNSGFNARGNGHFNATTQRYEDLLSASYFWMPESVFSNAPVNTSLIQYYCDHGLYRQNVKSELQGVRCIRKVAP